jgi:hypothetical protein
MFLRLNEVELYAYVVFSSLLLLLMYLMFRLSDLQNGRA